MANNSQSKSDRIDRTDVTVEQIERTLRASLCTDATLESWDYVEIGKGKGFLSCMVRMRLTWSADNMELPASVAVKIPDLTNLRASFTGEGIKNIADVIADQLMLLHNNETALYEMFAKVPTSERPISLPKYYGGKLVTSQQRFDGFIILEDLSGVSACADMSTGYNYAQAKNLVDALARLHAWCLHNGHVWNDGALQMGMEQLMEPMMGSMIESFESFVRWLREPAQRPFFGDTCAARVDELRPDMKLIEQFANYHRDGGLPDVLVHGDFWSNNILMRCEAGTTTPTDEIRAVIDWQLAHAGNPSEDLARLLLMSCDNDMRVAHTDELLQFYHSQLKAYLGDKEPPFDVPQLKHFYEHMFLAYVGFFAPFMKDMIEMVESGNFIDTSDPQKLKAKFMEDARGTVLDALRLRDKFADE